MTLTNKVVLVTGANGGLGTSVCRAFLDAGARVVGTARAIDQSEFPGAAFTAISAELADFGKAKAVVEQAGPVDVLVHLVGAFTGGKSVAETDDATMEKMFGINFRTAFHMTRAVLPGMLARGKGTILAIGSRTAVEPAAGVGAYSASKAALVSLISTIARETKDKAITANVILPGAMDTPANRSAMPNADPSKWIQPSTVAAMLVHLSSEAGRQITGAVIPVYGVEL